MTHPMPDRHGFSTDELCATVGAAQRASLGRGLTFALALAVSGLMVVYGPLAWGAPGEIGVGVSVR